MSLFRAIRLRGLALALSAFLVTLPITAQEWGSGEESPQAVLGTNYQLTALIPVGTNPYRAVMTPNGQEVYVSNTGSNSVSVISTVSNGVIGTVAVGTSPYALAVHPDGSKVYVGCMGGGVYIINTSTKAATLIGGSPAKVNDLAISPSGDRLYLATESYGLQKIMTATNAVSTIHGANCPEGVTFVGPSPFAYVNYQCAPPPGGGGNDPIYQFNWPTDAYMTGFTVGPPHVGSNAISASPDGSKIWAVGSGTVKVVRTSDNTRLATLTGGYTTVAPNSARAYVSTGTALAVYDTATLTQVDSFPIASSGSLAFNTSGCRFYTPVPGSNSVAVVDFTPGPPAAPTFSSVSCTTQTVNWGTVTGATSYDVWRSAGSCDVGCSANPYESDANTVLLDHFDGATSATIAGYVGGVACGGAAPVATARTFYAASAAGMGHSLGLLAPASQPAGSGSYLTYGTQDILSRPNGTLEYWVYLTDYNGPPGLDQGPYIGACAGWTFGMGISPTGQLSAGAWAAFNMNSGGTVVPLNQWAHLACSWGSSGAKLYINGQLVGSDSNTGAPASGYGGYLRLRVTNTGGANLVDELRLSNVQRTSFNTCRFGCTTTPYASDGTTVLLDHLNGSTVGTIFGDNRQAGCGGAFPAATPRYNYGAGPTGLDRGLAMLAPAGANASSETYIKYAGGELASRPNGTLEYWVYLTDYSATPGFDQGPYYGACGGWTFSFGVSGTGQIGAGAWAAFSMNSGTTVVPLKQWTHLACTWGSTGAKLYMNGVLVGSDANTGAPSSGWGGSLMLQCRATSGATMVDEVRLSNVQKTTFNLCPGPSKVASGVAGTTFGDTGLTPSTQYSYYVTANNGCGASLGGACASSTTTPPTPAAPGAPAFSAVACTSQTLTWAAVPNALTYDVWRATGGSCAGATKITTSPVAATTYGDSGLTPSTQYSYFVTADNACGTSASGTCASSTTDIPEPAAPSAPGAVDLAICSPTGVELTWSPVATATGYDLQVDGTTVVTDVTSPYTYIPGNTASHNFQVRAKNACGPSAWSTVTPGADTALAPPSVGTLTLQKFGDDLLISWVQYADPSVTDYYEVMRALAPEGPFDTSVGTATGVVHGLFLNLAAEPANAYYKVRGVKGGCPGPLD